MSGFTAPVNSGDSKRLDNVEIIPTGYQLCTFYGLADIGTQNTNFGEKHQVNLAFEFPFQMRIFSEGGELRPSAVFSDETMSMGSKANLRTKYIEQMANRKLTDEEAASYDISQLLGKHFIANIQHSPDGKWANITSLVPLDEQNKSFFPQLESASTPQINPTYYFHLSQGFGSENFANLPHKVREKLMNSSEGKAHKLAGGTFAERPKNNNQGGATASAPAGPSAPQGQRKLQMIATDYTYDQYIQAGWDDDGLVAKGMAKWIEPTPAPAPQPSAPSPSGPAGPSAPSAPAPAQPQAPPTPTPPPAPAKVLVFNDPNAQPLEEWIKGGWTEEMIVAQGHATFQ